MMEQITDADLVLDACGREKAPPGFKYVDLPAYLPMKATFTPGGTTPFQVRIKNNYKTEFHCLGIIFECDLPVRVKWPSGRYLSQNPSFAGSAGSPRGTGGNMIALNAPVTIQSGADITVEVSA